MTLLDTVKSFYETHYKGLLIIPFLLLFLAFVQIGHQYATTGDFIHRGVTLKGGSLVSFVAPAQFDSTSLEAKLVSAFPGREVSVRTLGQSSAPSGYVVESDIESEDQLSELLTLVSAESHVDRSQLSVEIIGSSLGASFFSQSLIALLCAFLLMGIVVFIYFRTPVPSLAVILAGFSDIVVTLAIFNLTGHKLSTAGIAAFLMLIGYSVDTDILLTSRVLKRKEGTVMQRVYGAINTGLSMTATTIGAVFVALIFVNSEVISQIMLILLIGLFVDMIFTWIQNVGILRLYLEKGGRK